MANPQRQLIFHQLRQVLGGRTAAGAPDAELLRRFAHARDEAAFELLLWRHGAMVLRVCRNILRDHQRAEDAFQATFLVLARKADAVRQGEALGAWLHRIAYRMAVRALAQVRACEPLQPGFELALLPAPAESGPADAEQRRVLHDEIERLPEKYRTPIILCYFESLSHEEAARRLGWPRGTVAGRLARARDLLRRRLLRRGVALAAGGLAAALATQGARAAAPRPLLDLTLGAAISFAARQSAATGLRSARAAAWAEGALKTMFWHKLKSLAAVLLAAGLVCTGAAAFLQAAQRGSGAPPAGSRSADADDEAARPDPRDPRELARQEAESVDNLKHLALAMHAYADQHERFPAPALYAGATGKGGGVGGTQKRMDVPGGTMTPSQGSTLPGGGPSGPLPGGQPQQGAGQLPTAGEKPSGLGGKGAAPLGDLGAGAPTARGQLSSAGGTANPAAAGGVPAGGDRRGPQGNPGTQPLGGYRGLHDPNETPAAGDPAAQQSADPLQRGSAPRGGAMGGMPPGGLGGGAGGQALLSWRVALLPYLGEQELYREFRLNEAWDSPHNKKLLRRMPRVFAPPGGGTRDPYTTYYQVFVGPHAGFEKHRALPISSFTDGTSNTILIVEAGQAVPWTKPEDLHYAGDEPLPELGGLFPTSFRAAFADGSVHTLPRKIDAQVLRALITRDQGEVVDLQQAQAQATPEGRQLFQQNEELRRALELSRAQVEELRRQKQRFEKDGEDPTTARLRRENAQLRDLLTQTQAERARLEEEIRKMRAGTEKAPRQF